MTKNQKKKQSKMRTKWLQANRPESAKPVNITMQAAAVDFITAAEGDGKKIPNFSMTAYTGGAMELAGWYRPVVIDLSGMTAETPLPILKDHDSTRVVGHADGVEITTKMVKLTGVISGSNEHSRELVESSGNGFPWRASVGCRPTRMEFVSEGQSVVVNGLRFNGPINVARKTVLGEVSFVAMPADPKTRTNISANSKENAMYFAKWLQAMGLEIDELNDEQKAKLQAKFDAEQKQLQANANQDGYQPNKTAEAEGNKPPTIDGGNVSAEESIKKDRQLQASEKRRVASINKICGNNAEIAAKAIEEGWSEDKTKLEVLQASYPQAPQVSSGGNGNADNGRVLEAALLISAGISDNDLVKDRDYGEQVVNAAYHKRGYGLTDVMAAALQSHGIQAPRSSQALFEAAASNAPAISASGFSSISLSGILGNVANKILLNAFLNVNTTYEMIAEQADFNNFHTHTMYRMSTDGDFTKVNPSGQLQHGKLTETSYTNKLDTYGTLIALTRQDIINDDLNAFSQLAKKLGRKAKMALEKALYDEIMESSDSYYTSAQGNLVASSALGSATLGAAYAALVGMTDGDGIPANTTGKYLLVPPQLIDTANGLYRSDQLNETTTANKGKPATNTWKGMFEPIISPYLSNSSMTGYSTTTWYLLADPRDVPAFQVAFLRGKRVPTIESADTAFNTLGWQTRCYFDFGVSQIDYRGIVKCTA